jgi:hypothetical protein
MRLIGLLSCSNHFPSAKVNVLYLWATCELHTCSPDSKLARGESQFVSQLSSRNAFEFLYQSRMHQTKYHIVDPSTSLTTRSALSCPHDFNPMTNAGLVTFPNCQTPVPFHPFSFQPFKLPFGNISNKPSYEGS